MLTKEKFLKDKISLHIKSPESNEDYVKLIQKLIDLGWKTYNNTSAENLDHYTWIYLPHIHEEYFEIHPRKNPAGQKEIQISDIIGENNQFEVGKWYKYTDWYIKLKEITHANIFIASDYIDNEKIYAGNLNRFTCGDANFQKVLLTDISEIQQYLPDGHVDKIIKEFVLPKKWCVKSTNDTIKALNDFIKSKGYGATLSYNYYIHYPFLNGVGAAYDSIQHGYTEITFDQFKQYVLKESVEEAKTIEKWSVGSYIVPLQDRLLSRTNLLTKGKPYEIIKLILGCIPYIIDNNGDEINFKTDFKDAEATQGIKWFPTLAEAEAFSKSLLEPKPLTIDNLVEGEIYKAHTNNHIYLFRAINKQGGYNLCLNISSKNSKLFRGNKENVPWLKIELPIYEERKWFIVCEKQDKIVPKEDLSKYDSEGNLIQVKPTFEFNKWYKSNNDDGLFFIQSKNTGYGFRSNHVNYWFTNNADFEWNIDSLEPATNEEVQERLLRYAKEKYLIGTKFKCLLYNKEFTVTNPNYMDNTLNLTHGDSVIWFGVKEQCSGKIFDGNGNWAKIVTKPENKKSKEMQLSDLKNPVFNIGDKVRVIADSLTEFNSSWNKGNNARYKKGYEGIVTSIDGCKSSFKEVTTWYYLEGDRDNAISCNLLELAEPVKKEFDKDWYVEVNSQEEADKVFDWLRAQGEPVINTDEWLKFRVNIDKYITYWKENNTWFVNSLPRENTYKKQLSDIIPNYSSQPKVDRNVYYEVSNQEQYEEILNWLESKGENVYTGSNVTKDWKYIYKDNFWCLYNIKPNLPKAKFIFKNKQDGKINISFEEGCPFPSFGDFSVNLSSENNFGTYPLIEKPTTIKKVKVQLINVPRI